MTEDEARQICAANDATLSIRRRGQQFYAYVCRFIPYHHTMQHGRRPSVSNGQQFEAYVCNVKRLAELTRADLEAKISQLPANPHKAPAEQERRRRAGTVRAFRLLRRVAISEARIYIRRTGGNPNTTSGRAALEALDDVYRTAPDSGPGRWYEYATERQRRLFVAEYEHQARSARSSQGPRGRPGRRASSRQQLERSDPTIARWHEEAQTPDPD